MSNKIWDNDRALNLTTFFTLYLARAIPATFIMTALQVSMREARFGLATIGLLSLVRLPWSFKFLWAPLIDRHCVTVGDYKKVIIATETVFALAILLTGFFNVKTDLNLIIALVLLSTFAASVQNVTNDALAVKAFGKGDHSAVNAVKSMGRYAGTILGSGILIMILHQYGWHMVVPFLGFFAILLMIPLILNKSIKITPREPKQRAKVTDFIWFFSQRKIYPQIGFLFLFFAGFVGVMSMLKPWLVDQGYNMKQIGLLSGIIGTSCSFVMAAFAGWWVKKLGLFNARRLVAILIIGVPVYFYALTFTKPSLALIIAGILYIKTCEASAATVLYTTAMERVRPGREGTDFTVQIVITHFSGAIIGVLSGGVGQWLDYRGLFLIETVIAVISLVYILLVFRRR